MSKRKQRNTKQAAAHGPRDGARPAGDRRASPPRHGTGPERRETEPWLYGTHAVLAALSNPRRKISMLLATAQAAKELPPHLRTKIELVEAESLGARLPPGAVHQGLAIRAAPLPDLAVDEACGDPAPDALVVVLDQVTDPHNVGAILRSAAAFGARALIVTDRHAPPVTGVLAKAASGALEHVPIVRVVNLARVLDLLGEFGYLRIGLASEAKTSLTDVAPEGPVALVLGAEDDGLRRLTRERCDSLVRLPTQESFGSLNVSNAAAVALYAVRAGR